MRSTCCITAPTPRRASASCCASPATGCCSRTTPTTARRSDGRSRSSTRSATAASACRRPIGTSAAGSGCRRSSCAGFELERMVHPARCHTGLLGRATNRLQFVALWRRGPPDARGARRRPALPALVGPSAARPHLPAARRGTGARGAGAGARRPPSGRPRKRRRGRTRRCYPEPRLRVRDVSTWTARRKCASRAAGRSRWSRAPPPASSPSRCWSTSGTSTGISASALACSRREDGCCCSPPTASGSITPHPTDFRRWTRDGLVRELESRGFAVEPRRAARRTARLDHPVPPPRPAATPSSPCHRSAGSCCRPSPGP